MRADRTPTVVLVGPSTTMWPTTSRASAGAASVTPSSMVAETRGRLGGHHESLTPRLEREKNAAGHEQRIDVADRRTKLHERLEHLARQEPQTSEKIQPEPRHGVGVVRRRNQDVEPRADVRLDRVAPQVVRKECIAGESDDAPAIEDVVVERRSDIETNVRPEPETVNRASAPSPTWASRSSMLTRGATP